MFILEVLKKEPKTIKNVNARKRIKIQLDHNQINLIQIKKCVLEFLQKQTRH